MSNRSYAALGPHKLHEEGGICDGSERQVAFGPIDTARRGHTYMWEMVNKDRDRKVCILFMQRTTGSPFGWIVGFMADMLEIRTGRVWDHHLWFWGNHKHGCVCVCWGQ